MKRIVRKINASTLPLRNNSRRIVADEEVAEGKGSAEFEALLDKLTQIGSYEGFISALKNLNDNQKELFQTYFGEIASVNPSVSDTGISVLDLIPTQSEIDWKKSLSRGLSEDCSHFFSSPVTLGMPVLTYKKKYIIDGHHRWSQVYMFNPKGAVACTNFDYPADSPIDVLKDFQAAVLAELGEVKEGTAGTNIWTVSKDQLISYISENITDACWKSLVKAGVAEDKESAISYITNNALTLQKKVKPIAGAPDRVYMPQTTKEVVKRATGALTDMSAATEIESSYGGAFDIEDDQYFTRDDLVDFGTTVCEHLSEIFYSTYDLGDVYMETPKKLHLQVIQMSDGSEYNCDIDIDMRKIRVPSDLTAKYAGDVIYALRQEIESDNNDVNATEAIMSAMKPREERIHEQIWNAVSNKMEDMGFHADEISDYLVVEVKESKDDPNYLKVEIRAELDYDGLMELIEVADPIVAAIDADAYFEPVTSGIADAYVHK